MFAKILNRPLCAHLILAAASIGWFLWIKGKLDMSYAASKHPVDYATGQTSFSADMIKG